MADKSEIEHILRLVMKYMLRFIVALAVFSTTAVFAHDYTAGSIKIDHPWSRATVAGIPNGVAYFVLENKGDTDDRLLSAASPVADKVELHTHLKEGEIVRMRQVDDVNLPAGETVAFEPGGLHVMLMGLKEPLEQDRSFPLTLEFDQAGSVTVEVSIDLMGGSKSGDDAAHEHHH